MKQRCAEVRWKKRIQYGQEHAHVCGGKSDNE